MIDRHAAAQGRLARLLIAAAFGVYLVFQLHAVAFHGYWGQDWIAHKAWVREAALHPWSFVTQYTHGRTNPPAYDLIAGLVRRLVGLRRYLPAIGVMDVVFGLIGMGFLTAVVRRLVASPVLQAACVIFALFLPFAMIHAEVMANDALATPMFWALVWLLARFDPGAPARRFAASTALIAVALMVSVEVKFTFGSFVIATALWIGLLWWTGRLAARRAAAMVAVVVLAPGLFTYAESARYRIGAGNTFGIDPPAHLADANMNPRSILGPRAADVDVLDAPPYNLTIAGQYDLLVPNKHSLAALLHLAVFTDVLNIYQYDPYDSYFGQRTIANQARMTAAVRAAVPASLFTATAVCVLAIGGFWQAVVRRRGDDAILVLLLTASLGWFLSLVVLYPSIPGAYYSGWWTPRLHAPAILGFFVAAFVWLDRLTRRHPRLQTGILVWTILQSSLQLSFLWPSPHEGAPLVEPNRDLAAAAAKAPVLRVLTWQDQWSVNTGAEAWMADTMGIVIQRGPGPEVETWRLRFRLQAGPSLPGRLGAIRVSARSMSPQVVLFDTDRDVQIDVPLVEGRNDIRLDLTAPDAVERPDDVGRRNVRVSTIEIQRADGR